ncbi:hypothetical protein KJ632_03510 [Patescibacteria group bacterium]|nr:hypothetical protein [Patescibacteria group bacterium]
MPKVLVYEPRVETTGASIARMLERRGAEVTLEGDPRSAANTISDEVFDAVFASITCGEDFRVIDAAQDAGIKGSRIGVVIFPEVWALEDILSDDIVKIPITDVRRQLQMIYNVVGVGEVY